MSIFKRIIQMVKKPKKPKKGKGDPHLAREAEKYETPIPSREYILAELEALGPPVKRRVLQSHFVLSSEDVKEAFRRRLNAMIRDGQLLKTPEGFFPIREQKTCEGILRISREGEGYCQTETGQRIGLSGPTLRGFFDGDSVNVQITHIMEEGNVRGRIVGLLKPIVPLIVGRFIHAHAQSEVIPFDRKLTQNIIIPSHMIGQAKPGDIVHVKILRDEKYSQHTGLVGEIIDILGDPLTPGIEIEVAIRKFDIPTEWPQDILLNSEKIAEKTPVLRGDRKDLTALPLVTIDGEDAKDFDDAVYCEPRSQGGWRLYVAIADVSHYVTPGSALDQQAIQRGNSTYFPGMVVPMLPEVLSNGLCSLKPNVPRYCVVCEMTISTDGEITHYEFYRGLMHSKARLTYTEVAEMLIGHESLRKMYEAVVPSLEALKDLYEALHRQRRARGAIDFDTIETKILFDQQGKIRTIIPHVRNVAHKMIEESMLAANVCSAKFLERHHCPTLFRIHDRPPSDKLLALRTFLAELGLDLPGRATPSAADFSALMGRIAHRDDRHVIETVMLRSLSQAVYSIDNIGHFGLAYESYCHFTSPIRRYPDLLVHRAILDTLKKPTKPHKDHLEQLAKIGAHCSQTERRSDEATRDASMALKCHFMKDKIGEHFSGVISGVASFGIFVDLKDIYIEGLVHVTALGSEYFQYDPAHHRMVGDRTRQVYRLGDKVDVIVMRVDVEAKKIDLELVSSSKTTSSDPKNAKNPSEKRSKKASQRKRRARKKRTPDS